MKHNYQNSRVIRLLAMFIVISGLAACSKIPVTASDQLNLEENGAEANYNQTIKRATETNNKAIALEHQWTTVPVLLSQAKEAADQNDFSRANELATEALKQAEVSVEQANQQAIKWRQAVPQ